MKTYYFQCACMFHIFIVFTAFESWNITFIVHIMCIKHCSNSHISFMVNQWWQRLKNVPYPSNFEILWDACKLNLQQYLFQTFKSWGSHTLCTKSYLQQNNINATDNRFHNHDSRLLPSSTMNAIAVFLPFQNFCLSMCVYVCEKSVKSWIV